MQFGTRMQAMKRSWPMAYKQYKIPTIKRTVHLLGLVFTVFWFSYLILS